MKNLFNRNIQARANLELLLVSAVSSLLLLRFYLYATGYPQVGGGSLHIAHMLYGGLCMLIAIVLQIVFLGRRAQRLAALIGGIGFGIFIDELGKFITKDNNYFFQPAIGLIYAVFIVLYLSFSFLTRRTRLRDIEYQLNALNQFEEAVMHDMDRDEKRRVQELLDQADPADPITRQLQIMLDHVTTVKHPADTWADRQLAAINRSYRRFWDRRGSSRVIGAVFIVEALLFVGALFGTLLSNVDDFSKLIHGNGGYGTVVIIGQLVSTVVAGSFALVGAIRLPRSRGEGFEWFRRAVLVNIFLTEFFIFSRTQFQAMPGFIANILLLLALSFALSQEQHAAPAGQTAKKSI
ncbi:MAG: putative rane protein [Candidatus Saccharibacteria bacterium]|nr:putative rane protein [Candidatus Saccharibacteria bacterium]